VNATTKRFSRSMEEAFPADRFNCGDPAVMRAISGLSEEFPQPRWPFEAASACSEFGHDDPPKPRLTLLQRAKRFFRAQQIKRLRP